MQLSNLSKETVHSYPIERSVFLGIGLLSVWFVAMMTFMANGQNHILNLAFIVGLSGLVIGLAIVLPNTRHQGYLVAIAATLTAVVGYFRLSAFFFHTETVFTLSVIGITARYGAKRGIFAAFLAMVSNGLLTIFTERSGITFDIVAVGAFFFILVMVVGTLTRQRETAIESRAQMNETLNQTYNETLRALVTALDTRDSETGGHSERVTLIALSIAYQMKLDEKLIQQIHWGALLHDVGKIGIPDQVLRKQGILSEEEWIIMRSHPKAGYEMLKEIPFLLPALDVVLHHHEKYDGSGYPSGLSGQNIPLAARIFAVADAFDAMTNDRPYRKAFTQAEAVAEIERCANTQFDPQVVEAFIQALRTGWENNPHTPSK